MKIQAGYFLATGIWPVLHMDSFLAVTGEKTDLWLVYMVGLLAVSIGICLFFERGPLLLGICSAASFALIDVIFVVKKVISPVYLTDCVLQLIFIACYIVKVKKQKFRLH